MNYFIIFLQILILIYAREVTNRSAGSSNSLFNRFFGKSVNNNIDQIKLNSDFNEVSDDTEDLNQKIDELHDSIHKKKKEREINLPYSENDLSGQDTDTVNQQKNSAEHQNISSDEDIVDDNEVEKLKDVISRMGTDLKNEKIKVNFEKAADELSHMKLDVENLHSQAVNNLTSGLENINDELSKLRDVYSRVHNLNDVNSLNKSDEARDAVQSVLDQLDYSINQFKNKTDEKLEDSIQKPEEKENNAKPADEDDFENIEEEKKKLKNLELDDQMKVKDNEINKKLESSDIKEIPEFNPNKSPDDEIIDSNIHVAEDSVDENKKKQAEHIFELAKDQKSKIIDLVNEVSTVETEKKELIQRAHDLITKIQSESTYVENEMAKAESHMIIAKNELSAIPEPENSEKKKDDHEIIQSDPKNSTNDEYNLVNSNNNTNFDQNEHQSFVNKHENRLLSAQQNDKPLVFDLDSNLLKKNDLNLKTNMLNSVDSNNFRNDRQTEFSSYNDLKSIKKAPIGMQVEADPLNENSNQTLPDKIQPTISDNYNNTMPTTFNKTAVNSSNQNLTSIPLLNHNSNENDLVPKHDEKALKIRKDLNIAEEKVDEINIKAKKVIDLAGIVMDIAENIKQKALSIESNESIIYTEFLAFQKYIEASKTDSEKAEDFDFEDSQRREMELLVVDVNKAMKKLQEISNSLPEELNIADEYILTVKNIKDKMLMIIAKLDCDKAHEFKYEHELEEKTGIPAKMIPHECEEQACAEFDKDDCETPDCEELKESLTVIPTEEEKNPCDEIVDVATRYMAKTKNTQGVLSA